ncbi:MAG TPA: efflux RND transporter periplasmic adaptor subunit [Planctomycetota bacterium]
MTLSSPLRSGLLLLLLAGTGAALAAWKRSDLERQAQASAAQPEPTEVVSAARARERQHQPATTAIGTVRALRSVTLQNELAGTVREVALVPGAVVEEGQLLVALDVAVEEAELEAQAAQVALTETLLGRMERAQANRGASEADVDRARAERDVALANVARTRAVIERKTIRAPFHARVGLADVHPGQYLDSGTVLTTLQGIDERVHVDFTVAQAVAAGLRAGLGVEVTLAPGTTRTATIVALDARVDPSTRNALVRAELEGPELPTPGASVRVHVPVGPPRAAVTVPVSALRKGPAGDHVFVVEADAQGQPRARLRAVQGGALLGDEVVIDAGLAAGEEVATSGSFKLREGVRLVVHPEATGPVTH